MPNCPSLSDASTDAKRNGTDPRLELPRKAIELLADPDISKVGVAIGGDAQKLLRDFPNEFPDGVRGILELTKVARKVDPINTGPGARLISLANLCGAYLGKSLSKESTVRGSDWSTTLSDVQKACEWYPVPCSVYRPLPSC